MFARALGCALATLLGACAGSPAMETASALAGPAPGHWQLVIQVDDLPGTGKIPPQTMRLCSSPEDRKQWQDMVGGKSAAGCSVTGYRTSGPTISYAMRCGGGVEGATTITIEDENNYRGESTIRLGGSEKPATIRSKVTATRLGPVCSK